MGRALWTWRGDCRRHVQAFHRTSGRTTRCLPRSCPSAQGSGRGPTEFVLAFSVRPGLPVRLIAKKFASVLSIVRFLRGASVPTWTMGTSGHRLETTLQSNEGIQTPKGPGPVLRGAAGGCCVGRSLKFLVDAGLAPMPAFVGAGTLNEGLDIGQPSRICVGVWHKWFSTSLRIMKRPRGV